MAETSAQQPRELLSHINALDGVRGLAILLVLITHVLSSNNHNGNRLLDALVRVRGAGWVGVDLFFALSGFLITGILYQSLHDRHFFKNFYARRVLRIFPVYYATILLLVLAFHRVIPREGAPFLLLAAYLQNTPLYFHLFIPPDIAAVIGHFWSLAVEEQFYMVWPFLVWAVRDRKRLMWLCVVLSLGALTSRLLLVHFGAPSNMTYKLTFCRADSLLAGAWLALVLKGPSGSRVLRAAPYTFCAAMLGCGVIAWTYRDFSWETMPVINQYGYSILALASTSLVAMALRPQSVTARAMRAGWLRFLGRYSYGIYVYHQIVVALVQAKLAPLVLLYVHGQVAYRLLVAMLVLLITLMASWLSFRFFELPFLKLKRYFNYETTGHTATTLAV